MRLSIALSIFRKEIRETLRDRRTLAMMILFPMIVYPVLILAMSWLQESRRGATEARPSQVAVWGEPPAGLLHQLRGSKNLELKPWLGSPPASAGTSLKESTSQSGSPTAGASRKTSPRKQSRITRWRPQPALWSLTARPTRCWSSGRI